MIFKKGFKYIEPLWLGKNNRVSIRSTLAIAFAINFMVNLTHAVNKWDSGRSLSDLALVLGIEAGLIAGLLALRTYQNMQFENHGGGGYDPQRDYTPGSFKGSGGGSCGVE